MLETSAEAGAKANTKAGVRNSDGDSLSRGAGERQRQVAQEEFREAVRALLMRPLLGPQHEGFAEVYRHAEALREWFLRETGWMLEVERGGARLFKRPADLGSAVRGLDDYDRRRYVLLCLACAVLERADPQITLRILGERLLSLAAGPELPALGFSFTLTSRQERSELVSVCRTLLDLGVLRRVAGEEEAFVQGFMQSGMQPGGEHADALYDIHRRALAGMLAVVRGPSTWAPQDAPAALEDRLRALVEEPVADSEEGRRTAVRHHLARRLLDDPVVYLDSLGPEARAYFVNQRGPMATRLCDATGLTAEARAEGLALVDETGALTDVAMPAEGTEAHATLLVADFLARGWRQSRPSGRDGAGMTNGWANGHVAPDVPIRTADIVAFLREAKVLFGKYWRKSARTAGAEAELAETAAARLEKLHLIERRDDSVVPLPALARFHLGEATVRSRGGKPDEPGQLFADRELELTS
jgi:uncharacterized protein (TIGR02678 family)